MRKTPSTIVRVLQNDYGIIERFWSRVAQNPAPAGCWEWNGGVKGGRYPTFFIGNHSIAAARVAWFIATDELPIGGRLLHVCENDRCVRPTHLIWAIGWRTNRTRIAREEGYLVAPVSLVASDGPDAAECRRFSVPKDPIVPMFADPALESRVA